MKCPKCGYLGFERVDRCRNCGYDFSLAEPVSLPELPIRSDDTPGLPVEDLALVDVAQPPPSRPPAALSSELPLFGPPIVPSADDEPLITKPSPPRPPLAVRRATPELPRLRGEQPRSQMMGLDLDVPSNRPLLDSVGRVASAERRPGGRSVADTPESPADAGLIARFVAVVIDLTILAAIDAAVIYFTMQICGITLDEWSVLPKAPLLAFLLVQNGGYLVAFTAGGQTLGKMAARIKVVASGQQSQLDLGRAMLRTFVWLVLALPVGLGFLTALFSKDRRGLHDRFAGTRVVRALA